METAGLVVRVLCLGLMALAGFSNGQLQSREKLFITAPNVFRVGVNETVTAAIFNSEGSAEFPVTIYLERRESRIAQPYSSKTVVVQRGTSVTTTVRVDPEHIAPLTNEDGEGEGEGVPQYVYLVASAPSLGFQEEKQILVSPEAGYLLLQTDKPIYTPNQEVKIRVVAVDQEMKPSTELVHLMVLNPQGIIVRQFRDTRAVHGFMDKTFGFETEPMFGNWSVTVLHGLQFQKNKTITFEVREYVLPSFTIKINTPDFILRSTDFLDINFEAKHVYQKPVEGTFLMTVGILQRDGSVVSRTHLTASLENGIGGDIIYPEIDFGPVWFDIYEGSRLHVEVKVNEISTGMVETAVDISTPIVTRRYRFKPGQTVQYFKPGLPYELQFELESVLGMPAQHELVNIEVFARTPSILLNLYNTLDQGGPQGSMLGGQHESNLRMTDVNGRVRFRFNTTTDVSQINVRVSTTEVNEEEDAVFTFDAIPYISPTEDNSYLSIHIDQSVLRDGDEVYAIIQSSSSAPIDNLNLLFFSQGKLVLSQMLDRVISNPERIFFRVTADMVPVLRVVAYYINRQGQVVADAVAVKIENTCKHYVGLNVQEPRDEYGAYPPESPLTLLVDAFPTSYVGLVGVDKAVYALSNKHLLTRKKVFEMMQTYDVGCGPGGGLSTPAVFKDSGLTVLTNAQLTVPTREGLACESHSSRKRRNAVNLDVPDKIETCLIRLHDVCEDNLSSSRMENKIQRWNSCSKIATKLGTHCPSATKEQIESFTECCQQMMLMRTGLNPVNPNIGDSSFSSADDFDLSLAEEFGADVRSDFRETWLFDLIRIGETGRASLDLRTPGSITEWSLQAVSVTPTGGLCVTDPLNVNVFKPLTVQMKLPFSVVRLEQIEILVTVYNYHAEDADVEVSFYNPKGCCGESVNPSVPATRRVTVEGNDSQSLKFVVVPIEVGELPITVTVTSDHGTDGAQKILRVIPHGVPQSVDHSVLLDPSGIYRQHRRSPRLRAALLEDIQSDQVIDTDNNIQFNVLDIIPPEDIVPGTEAAVVTLIGNMLGPILVDPVSNYGNWLQLPKGCGEQTMGIVAPTIFVLHYLRTVKLLNTSVEEAAMDRISRGMAQALSFRREDGSFSIWATENYNSSTWLTSFVLKVFSHADQLMAIDRTVTCKATEWLVHHTQHPNGSFSERYMVHHKEMTGGVSGEAAMTAYVLISLVEGHWCEDIETEVTYAISRAKRYLEDQVGRLDRPYSKAIVTYALALVKSEYAADANLHLRGDAVNNPGDGSRHWRPELEELQSEDLPHWYHYRPSAIAVETTGYALLAQLEMGEISYAGSIALWLSEQQNYEGGFISTQDTVIALQALTKYADMANNGEDLDLTCTLTSEVDDSFHFEHHFLPHNALVQQEVEIPVGGRLRSECQGKGTGKLSVQMKFHRQPSSEDVCPFEVTYNAQEARSSALPVAPSRSRVAMIRRSTTTAARSDPNKGDFVATIRFCARYTQNTRTNMGIIDVGLYSGFVLASDRLEDMVRTDHLHLVRRFEVSQRSVIFYLDRIPADQNVCIEFNARREVHVGNVQPVAIRVYDYYSPDKSCTTFYHPLNWDTELLTLCNDAEECICATERCSLCDKMSLKDFQDLACSSHEHYAFRVRMESQHSENGYTVYIGNVTRVIKTGVDNVVVGSLRHFYKRERCECPKIKLHQEHTIVGSASLRETSDIGIAGHKYLLDDRSIVEVWPTKISKKRNREAVEKLQAFEDSSPLSCT